MKKEMMKKLLLAVVLSTLTIALSGCTGDKSGDPDNLAHSHRDSS